ncbi:hypothetical protein B566_EDAN018429 [Ephemera danica]|nr:hypothetical protein B566_EDAN018429 [Ephemera danica]
MCFSVDGVIAPCAVSKCKDGTFNNFDLVTKQQFVETGKPTPKLPNLMVRVQGKRNFLRKFHDVQYKTYDWLTACSSDNKLYCWPCLLYSANRTVWNTTGYSDLNNLSTAIKTHVKSSAHIGATLDLSSFAKRTIHAGFDHQQRASTIQHNANVAKNRDILKRLIDVVLHLANQELAFRGHDESETSLNQGNYIEALKLLAKYDRELQEHLSQPPNAPFKGTSSHIQNDIILSIASVLRQAQDNDIRNAEFLAMNQLTRDKSSQLSTVLRYCVNGEVRETFRGFTDVSRNRSANALCEHVKRCIEELNCGH